MTHTPLPYYALALQAEFGWYALDATDSEDYYDLVSMARGARLLAHDPDLIMYLVQIEKVAEELASMEDI